MNNKVFISYASEDIEYARSLYKYLKDYEFQPWLDKEHLLPGMKGILRYRRNYESLTS